MTSASDNPYDPRTDVLNCWPVTTTGPQVPIPSQSHWVQQMEAREFLVLAAERVTTLQRFVAFAIDMQEFEDRALLNAQIMGPPDWRFTWMGTLDRLGSELDVMFEAADRVPLPSRPPRYRCNSPTKAVAYVSAYLDDCEEYLDDVADALEGARQPG